MTANLSPPRDPDFLCVGMPKAGTTWLYRQLSALPGYSMPPIKELHIHDLEPLARRRNYARQLDLTHDKPDRATLEFRDAALEVVNQVGYRALFSHLKPGITGDITPAYCALPDGRIAQLRREMPEVKVVMAVRDPVERIWSALRALLMSGQIALADMSSWPILRNVLEKKVGASVMPTGVTLQRWQGRFDLHPVVFDDMVSRPRWALGALDTFLGGDVPKPIHVPRTKRNSGPELQLEPAVRRGLVAFLEADLRDCAGLLGRPGRVWRDRYL